MPIDSKQYAGKKFLLIENIKIEIVANQTNVINNPKHLALNISKFHFNIFSAKNISSIAKCNIISEESILLSFLDLEQAKTIIREINMPPIEDPKSRDGIIIFKELPPFLLASCLFPPFALLRLFKKQKTSSPFLLHVFNNSKSGAYNSFRFHDSFTISGAGVRCFAKNSKEQRP